MQNLSPPGWQVVDVCEICSTRVNVDIVIEEKHYCKTCASVLLQIPIEALQQQQPLD